MRTGFPSDPLGLPHVHGGTSTRDGMHSGLRSLPHTHGGALKCLSEEEDSPPPHTRGGNRGFSPVFSLC